MLKSKIKTTEYVWLILLLLSVVAAIIKIFVGFDIDEGYAVSMPYRLLQGDHMFLDMWEVHQTSSFLPAVALRVYDKITGDTAYAVIYLRILATVIHAVFAYLIYRLLQSDIEKEWAVLLSLLYFNLLPKWLVSLDFSLQQVWGITLVMFLLFKLSATGKNLYAFGMGIALAGTVLAYPGMVMAYPALLISVFMMDGRKVKSKINNCVAMSLGCALMAVLFFVYVLSSMRLSQFIESIPMIFMDGTHQFTFRTKCMAYVMQWANVIKQMIILAVPSAIIAVVFYCVQKKKGKERNSFLIFLLSFLTVTSFLVIFANVIGIKMGPFHFQVRYLLFFFLVFALGIRNIRKKPDAQCKIVFWGPLFQMMISFIAILIFSNVGPDSSSSYLGVGLIAGAVLIYKETKVLGADWNRIAYAVLSVFVLSLIFCKGYYVRITEYGPSNILQKRIQVEQGPLAGIYLLEEDYARVISDLETIRAATEGEDNLLYLGTEGISNLYGECGFVSPSTISTPAFNQQWVDYFELYPQKEPGVIVLAKNTIDNREKFFAQNPLGIWIAKRYDVVGREETESLCVIKKK